ncbi:hypothetical protein [Roseateles koreensis]|uniref:DUF928 domain-containing protein n=1 Tax=Roseateles koreensis TaxID=2987526 RepID=A0ABT5KR82_9BURK|nr:hypothetical protein [Roseateles koreensis]MDC8784386.1 hypothetical protein [Roseateles koreensis]
MKRSSPNYCLTLISPLKGCAAAALGLGCALATATLLTLTSPGVATAQSPRPDCSLSLKAPPSAKGQTLADEVARSNPCVAVPGLSAKSLTSVWNTMLSSAKTGGKRFDTPPPAGLPTGKVLITLQGLEFKLDAVAAEGVLGLQIRSGNQLIFSISNPGSKRILVPATQLKFGETYEWVLVTRKGSYKGSFETLEREESTLVLSRITALEGAALSPATQQLYLAAIFDDAELYADRDQILADLRRDNGL